MIDVQLSRKNTSKTIVTLYGNIIEYFSALNYDGGRSIHVGHLTSIGITTNKKGKHELLAAGSLYAPALRFLSKQSGPSDPLPPFQNNSRRA